MPTGLGAPFRTTALGSPGGGGLALSYTVTGAKEAEHRLLGIGERALDARPALQLVGARLRAHEAETFESEGASAGTPWAPLKPATLAYKAAHGYPSTILEATGRLLESLTEEGGEHFEITTRDSITFGTSVFYAAFHQAGTSKMAARPVATLPRPVLIELTKIIQVWLVGFERPSFSFGLGRTSPFGIA